ncbi:MAG: magnesium transporter [Gammaproteobacteria bacterium]
MEALVTTKPWDRLRELLAEQDASALAGYLDALSSDDIVRAVFRLTAEEQATLITSLPPDAAADLIDEVPESHAAEILEDIPAEEAASIVGALDSDMAADVLAELDEDDLEEILGRMDPEAADDARQLISYPSASAGGLMMTELVAFRGKTQIGQVVAALANQPEDAPLYLLQQIMVTSPAGALRGAVNLSDIAFAEPKTPLREFLKPVESVPVDADLNTLEEFFETHDEISVAPVVDSRRRLLGIVRRRAVFDAIADKADEDAMKRQGIVGGEELRSMPVAIRSGRRLSWLSVNILLNIVAASVIAMYQETLAAAIALAVFLPIVSDMSGCSGNQAVAVSMRELTLGIVRPADAFRVWRKEVTVGLINGVALGALIAGAAYLWQQSLWLAVVVGSALALNTLVAVSIGGTVPLLLKGMKIDPALASGPILTTITDMCGFFLVLSLASAMLVQ